MGLVRKALNYDLDDNKLKLYYPNPKSYKNAWRDIKGYLCKNGFKSRQYSGVVSINPMKSSDVEKIVDNLNKTFKWLAPCVIKFDVTNVSKLYSLKHKFIINNENEIDNTKSKNEIADTHKALNELCKELKELKIGNNNYISKAKDITKGNEL